MDALEVLDPSGATEVAMLHASRLDTLNGKTIALLDIAKERSDEFLDTLETRFVSQGFIVKRYRKASNSKNAAQDIVQAIVSEADIVVEGLAD